MKQILFTTILLLVFCFSAYSQTNESVCPANFTVSPKGVINPGETVKFGINLGEDATKSNLKYEWTISAGIIVKGQGTSEIELATSEEIAGSNITVSVEIKGLAKDCLYSDVFGVAQALSIENLDSFGKKELNEYRARLDALFLDVNRNPNLEGVISIIFDRKDNQNYKKRFLKNTVKHIKFRKLNLARFTFAIVENNSEQTTFWAFFNDFNFNKHFAGYTIMKGEDLEQKINELFPKK